MQSAIFRWRSGLGWLVLSGGGDFTQNQTLDLDSMVLRRTISDNPIALVWAASDIDLADRYLDYLDDLGGRTHFMVDVITEDDDSIRSQISEAGIVILMDGPHTERLRNGLTGAAMEGLITAYETGASIYAQGNSAGLLATWLGFQDRLLPGFGWLDNALLVPYYDAARATQLKRWLQHEHPDAYGVGLGLGAALALSGEGELELWGEPAVTVLLGHNLNPDPPADPPPDEDEA